MKTLYMSFVAVLLSLSGNLYAAETQAEAARRGQDAFDAAYSQAKAQAAEATAGLQAKKTLPGPAAEDMRKPGRADPLVIAKAYEDKTAAAQKPKQDLLVFISTSMPKRTLELLGKQAEQSGAVLVLRGLVGKVGTAGAVDATIKALEPVAATGATIQIDPAQFATYDVRAVPTFVLAHREEGCAPDQCSSTAFSLVGDVSLEFALETWAKRGGAAGKLAAKYLARLGYK